MFHNQKTDESARTITLSPRDIGAARRVLRLLLGADRRAAEVLEFQALAEPLENLDRAMLKALARESLANRRRRTKVFGQSMFGEAAWDMLLTLYIMDFSGARQTVGDVMKMAGTPSTTALRWLGFLVSHGYVRREEHPTDRRANFVMLTDRGRTKMDEYFYGTVRTEL